MVIVWIAGGLGNQFAQYVAGRLLAYKLGTELKLDVTWFNTSPDFNKRFHAYYRLGNFNVLENFATLEEIKHVKENGITVSNPLPKLETLQGDIYMQGYWPHDENNFAEISDIVRREFTLKKPFSIKAEFYRQKILSAESSVLMHFRHGDFAYNPNLISNDIHKKPWFSIVTLDYYYTCIDILKHRYSNLTVFVFSDNLPWVKENLHLDVPTEFVEGCETDDEEFILMSLCKYSIIPISTFSECATSLNSNPDKKIFEAAPSTAEKVQEFIKSLTPAKMDSILDNSGRGGRKWIPFDYYNQPKITQRPIFSLLLVVNNDAKNLPATLDSLLNQDYKYYEVIIIDNASTDGSEKICQDAVKDKKNVTFKRLESKVNNATAWNIAFKAALGKYVSFLKVGDRFLANSFSSLYVINEYSQTDIIHMFSWLEEDDNGNVTFDGKKFSTQGDSKFNGEKRTVIIDKNGRDAMELLSNHLVNSFLGTNLPQINTFLGTKLYNSEFLTEHKIKFDESLDDNAAENFFQIEAFLATKYFMYIANAFYIAPLEKSEYYFTARIDIQLVPKTQGDFQILSTSDDKVKVWKPGWFNKDGIGYQIQSRAGKLEIVARATVDGQVKLYLRGVDVRRSNEISKRLTRWIDYTKLIVNGKSIFDKITPAWHDQPYQYNMDAEADDEIKIQVEWLPHKSDI